MKNMNKEESKNYYDSLLKIFKETGNQLYHKKVIHIKTGDTYYILFEGVLNCTNNIAEEYMNMVVYQNEDNKIFVREEKEFWQKFTTSVEKIYNTRDYIPDTNFNNIPPACRYCSNHPNNGGSGVCHCIMGSQIIYS